MKKIELEVLTEAFQMQMEDDGFVIVYFKDDDEIFRNVLWWDDQVQELQNPFTLETAYIPGKMTGWSKIPYFE